MHLMVINKINRLISFKIIRFLFVGAFNTLVSFSVFSFLYFIGLHYFIASLLTLIAGMFISFNTHRKFTFSSLSKEYENYIFIALFIYVVSNYFLYLADISNINIYLAYFIILFPSAIINFLLLKKFVFK